MSKKDYSKWSTTSKLAYKDICYCVFQQRQYHIPAHRELICVVRKSIGVVEPCAKTKNMNIFLLSVYYTPTEDSTEKQETLYKACRLSLHILLKRFLNIILHHKALLKGVSLKFHKWRQGLHIYCPAVWLSSVAILPPCGHEWHCLFWHQHQLPHV